MGRHNRKQKAKKFEYFEVDGTCWHPVHRDQQHAWIVEYDKARKNCGGPVKKVDKSFLDSQEMVILAL